MKNFSLLCFATFFFFANHSLVAQNNNISNNNIQSSLHINPAYSGLFEWAQVSFYTGFQWVGLDGAPEISHFTAHSPIKFKNLYLGFNINAYSEGREQHFELLGNFATTVQVSKKTRISFGGLGGIGRHFSNFENGLDGPFDPSFQDFNNTNLYLGVGLILFSPQFFIAASVPYLIKKRLSGQQEVRSDIYRPMVYFETSYIFHLSTLFFLKPRIRMRVQKKSKLVNDFGLFLYFKENVHIGFSRRNNISNSLSTGLNISRNIKMQYTYTLFTNTASDNNQGSHEFNIFFELDLFPKRAFIPKCFF